MNIDPVTRGLNLGLRLREWSGLTKLKIIPVLSLKQGLWRWLVGSVFGAVAIGLVAMLLFAEQRPPIADVEEAIQTESDEPIQPIQPIAQLDPWKVELGKKLFSDKRLSHDNQLSCASCHFLKSGGGDGLVRSKGIHGAVQEVNTPTVLNSGFNFTQFWDGRSETLEAQADKPIVSKKIMGSTWPEVIAKLGEVPEYKSLFRRIYKDGVQRENVDNSLAEFERSLSTPNCRFDRYLRHDTKAITGEEQQGYSLFKSYGCTSCHQGMNIGGNMYQKMGVMAPYFKEDAKMAGAELGRFNITRDPRDQHMFKVPSLRNVELTAPYFHDGSVKTLNDAVAKMAKYQLGHPLTIRECNLIVAFLRTLTGELGS